MTWLRLDDGFATHPKVLGVSDAAFRVLVESYCYSAQHLTDGLIVDAVVARISSPKTRRELVGAGLWDEVVQGIQVHDYLEYNPSRSDVDERREKKRAAGRAGAIARWQT